MIVLLVGCALVTGGSALDGYGYYQTVDYSGCDRAVYQQDLVIHRTAGTAYEETVNDLNIWHLYVGVNCKADYGDLRFTDATDTELPYYIWPDCDSNSARVAVRLNGDTGNEAVTLWYGNAGAVTTSDGGATYYLFDQFDGAALDTDVWNPVDASVIGVGNGRLYTSPEHTYDFGTIRSRSSIPSNITLQFRIQSRNHTTRIGFGNADASPALGGVGSSIGLSNYVDHDSAIYTGASYSAVWTPPRSITKWSDLGDLIDDPPAGYFVEEFVIPNGDYLKQCRDGGAWTTSSLYTGVSGPYPIHINFWRWQPGSAELDYILARAYSPVVPTALAFSEEQIGQSSSTPTQTPTGLAASFAASPASGTTPLTVQFTDTSTGGPTAWLWTFDDGATSTEQHPTHTYTNPGIYSVTLTAMNADGSDTYTKIRTVVAQNPLIPIKPVITSPTYNTTIQYDMANGTYLQYWLYNVTTFGDIPIYGFAYGIMAPWMNVWGYWTFVIIWLAYLFIVWIRTSDIGLPIVIGLLTAGVWGIFFPPEAMQFALLMFGIAIAALLTKLAIEYI
jgi:hypothetical protein